MSDHAKEHAQKAKAGETAHEKEKKGSPKTGGHPQGKLHKGEPEPKPGKPKVHLPGG